MNNVWLYFWGQIDIHIRGFELRFYKNLPKTVCFDNGIQHFDASKPQNRPLTPLIFGVGVCCFDRMSALHRDSRQVFFWKNALYEVLILSQRYSSYLCSSYRGLTVFQKGWRLLTQHRVWTGLCLLLSRTAPLWLPQLGSHWLDSHSPLTENTWNVFILNRLY